MERLRYSRNIVRAKIYLRQMFEGFGEAAEILLPSDLASEVNDSA